MIKKIVSVISACFILFFIRALLNRTGSLILFWKEEPLGSITHDSGYGYYAFVRDENISKLGLPFFLKEDETILEQAPLSVNEDITASVNFNDVHSAGTARLEIKAVCSSGTVVDIEPAYIEVEIDDIITRVLSVDQEFVGELQPGRLSVRDDVTLPAEGPSDSFS